jgi:PPM family protein phosphatase
MRDREATTTELPLSTLDEIAAKYFGPVTPEVRVDFGALSHPGKVRVQNEDHYAVVRRQRSREALLTNLPAGFLPRSSEEAYAMTVADGVGGAAFGELASRIVFRVAWELTGRAYKWSFKLTQEELAELAETVRIYGQLIHRELREHSAADPRMAGMATTLTSVLTAGCVGQVAHVGDSRAYLFRRGRMRQLTRDHTLAQRKVDEGSLSSLEEASTLMRSVLTNCLGGDNVYVHVDVQPFQLGDGDRLLLCTDGLTDMVSAAEIAHTLSHVAEPQAACQALVDLALDHGGKDNVTVVLARFAVAAEEGGRDAADRGD